MKWENPSLIKLITEQADYTGTTCTLDEAKPITLERLNEWFDLMPGIDNEIPYMPYYYTGPTELRIYPWDFTELKSPKMDMRYHFIHNYVAPIPRPYSLGAWATSGMSDLSPAMQQEVDESITMGKNALRGQLLLVLCNITLKKIDEEERSDHDTTR